MSTFHHKYPNRESSFGIGTKMEDPEDALIPEALLAKARKEVAMRVATSFEELERLEKPLDLYRQHKRGLCSLP